jgi:hypothetical protein
MKTTIDMAKEAGLFTHKEVQAELKAFEALVRAAEREACAQVVEEYPHWLGMTAKAEIANAIRTRGQT